LNYRIERQAAYVLHSRPYRDTSALVDLFSLEYGRVSVVCRGVRRPNSKIRSVLQPFVPLHVNWQGRNDLKTLTTVESTGHNGLLAGQALICALYANELLQKLLEVFDPHPKLYVYYQYLLTALAEGDIEIPLRIFEYQLLKELGVLVSLEGLDATSYYYFNPCELVFEKVASINKGRERYYFYGEYLSAIYQGDYTNIQTRRCAKRFTRMQIEVLLDGRPLNSRRLLSGKKDRVPSSVVADK